MPTSHIFPVANPTKPFWLSTEDDFKKFRSTELLPTEVDIVIIGAGFTGASISYYLSQAKTSTLPKTLCLEARDICSGASGRNGGHCKPDYYRFYNSFVERYGEEDAANIGNFEYDNLQEVKRVVDKHQIDCDFVLTRTYNCHVTVDSATESKSSLLNSLSNPYNRVKHDIHYAEGDQAVTLSKVKGSKLTVSFTAAQLWPFKMIKQLFLIALSKSFLNLQANTPVKNIETLSDGTYLVHTSRGTVKTKKVILATNAYTAGLLPKMKNLIVPVKGTCSHIKVTDDKKPPYLTNTYAILRDRHENEYLINRPDGTIIVGGAKHLYQPDLPSWYGNVDDSSLFKRSPVGSVQDWYKTFMQHHYYTWESRKTEVDYLWTGIMGYSADSLPFTGEIPGEPNKFLSAGFNGHGMPRVMLCAKAISQCLLTGDSIEDTGIPRPFMMDQKRLDTIVNKILEETHFKYSQEEKDVFGKTTHKL